MSEGPRWVREWPEFEQVLKGRLQDGYERYGDWSFDRPLESKEGLLSMVEEEVLDIIGWSFIVWTRLKALRQAME